MKFWKCEWWKDDWVYNALALWGFTGSSTTIFSVEFNDLRPGSELSQEKLQAWCGVTVLRKLQEACEVEATRVCHTTGTPMQQTSTN